jgi:hypothetical protein
VVSTGNLLRQLRPAILRAGSCVSSPGNVVRRVEGRHVGVASGSLAGEHAEPVERLVTRVFVATICARSRKI